MDELTPEQKQQVDDIRRALEEEMRVSEDTTSHRKSALNDLEDLKGDFLGALQQIAKFSQNESLKAKVAMWGYDKLLEQGKVDSDPIRKLIEGMEAARATSPNE